MNDQETLMIIALLNRAGLVNAVQGQVEAWGPTLQDVSFNDTQAGVQRIISERTSTNSWVVPGDVLRAIRDVRNDRVRTALNGGVDPMPPREIDPDDIRAYQLWRKTFLKSLGDGNPLHVAEEAACNATNIPVIRRSANEFTQLAAGATR